MLKIPYGATVSCGDIAKAIERKSGGRVSAQAVGGGLGNKASLLVHEGG